MVGKVSTEQMTGVDVVNLLMFVFNICIFGGISGPDIFKAQYYEKTTQKAFVTPFASSW